MRRKTDRTRQDKDRLQQLCRLTFTIRPMMEATHFRILGRPQLQVQAVDQTTLPPSWNSFVGTGIQDGPVPPALFHNPKLFAVRGLHTHTAQTYTCTHAHIAHMHTRTHAQTHTRTDTRNTRNTRNTRTRVHWAHRVAATYQYITMRTSKKGSQHTY